MNTLKDGLPNLGKDSALPGKQDWIFCLVFRLSMGANNKLLSSATYC